jgi:hypothetical protein
MTHARLLLALLAFPLASASAAGLGGSRASLREAYDVARENDFTFLRTAAQVREFVREERLEEVRSSEHLLVNNVSFPYTRPIIRVFIERLAEQYHAITGERLVVTSLTRPTSLQPRNASRWSVHPAGMAVDLRIPRLAMQRKWLEETLLSLEERDLLDVTRERHPPHYHVAVFPEQYAAHVARLVAAEPPPVAMPAEPVALEVPPLPAPPMTPDGFPLPGVLTLVGGLLLVSGTGALTIRHARRRAGPG